MSNVTYFSDRWFSVVKTDEEAMAEGVYNPQGFLFGYIITFGERVAGKVIYCYEE